MPLHSTLSQAMPFRTFPRSDNSRCASSLRMINWLTSLNMRVSFVAQPYLSICAETPTDQLASGELSACVNNFTLTGNWPAICHFFNYNSRFRQFRADCKSLAIHHSYELFRTLELVTSKVTLRCYFPRFPKFYELIIPSF